MPIICWGNLAKAADDTQRIEQAIDEYIEGHNENPNAHMGENYALGAHRLQTVLDHSPYSVFNLHTYPQARSYKAIVDPTGNQDFTDIQAAIDYVHSLGGGAIFIKAGTYEPVGSLKIYSNISLVGEGQDLTFIKFNAISQNILTDYEYHDVEGDGWSIDQDTNIITGVNTNFTVNVLPGDMIEVNNQWFEIASVDSDTQLTLVHYYRGPNFSDDWHPYIFKFCENISISNLTFIGNTQQNPFTWGNVSIIRARYVRLEDVTTVIGGDLGFYIFDVIDAHFENCRADDVTHEGFVIGGVDNSVFINCSASNCKQRGFYVSGSSILTVSLIACSAQNNKMSGFFLGGADYSELVGCAASGNILDGVSIGYTNYPRIIGGNFSKNGGYGIDIENSGVVGAIITGNHLLNNTSGSLRNLGTDTEIGHNVTS